MIDQDIKKFVLRRLLQKNGEPATAVEIKLAIRSAFSAAFTEGDLDSYIAQLEADNYLAGTSDSAGGARVELTFKPGTDPDLAWAKVQNKLQLALAALPDVVQQTGVTVSTATALVALPILLVTTRS